MSPRTHRGRVTLATVLVLAFLVALGLGLAACGGGSESGGGGTTTTSESPKAGGTLTLSYLTEPSSLDPAVAWNVIDWNVEHAIFESFFRYVAKSGEEGTKLEPCLATEVPTIDNGGISKDGKVITIHLREGVKFQPPVSREVTAEDFKYSFERMLRSPLAPGTSFYYGVAGAEDYSKGKADTVKGFQAVDDYTVKITLTGPDLSFLNALTMEFCDVLPKEWVDKWGKKVNRHPLGTGPFMFDHWTPGQEIVLNRNPQYWDAGKPYLDSIVYKLSYEPATAYLKLKNGEVDALGDGLPTADLVATQSDPQWKDYIYSQPLIAISYIFMDVHVKPFDNVKVRQAVSWAIDRAKVVKLQGGQATELWQLYPEGMPGHEAGKKYYGYDPEKAKALLAEAGYPDGFKTTFTTDNVDPNPKLAQSIQADLQAVGIDAEIQTMNNNTFYVQQSTPGKLAMGSFAWWMDFPDPVDWVIPLFSKSNAVQGGMNSSFWWDPKVESMLVEAQAMTDAQKRIAKFTEIQQYILDQAAYATVYSPTQTTMCSKNVGGFYLHPVYQIDPAMYWKK